MAAHEFSRAASGVAGDGRASRFSKQQITAVILTDMESDAIHPITNDVHKSLLPIANRPLLQYQLDTLAASGFTDAVVVTTREAHPKVNHFVLKDYKGDVSVELVMAEDHFNTADMLRHAADRIRTDFLVVMGNLVLGKHLSEVIDQHRARRSDVTLLLKELPVAETHSARDGGKGKKKPVQTADEDDGDTDYFGIVPKDHRVIMMLPRLFVDSGHIRLSKALLRRVPCYTVHGNMVNSGLYLCSQWVLELIQHKQDFDSLEEDVIPYIVRQQFKGPDAFGTAVSEPVGISESEDVIASLSAGSDDLHTHEDGPRVYAHILSHGKGYCTKITSKNSYLTANKEIMEPLPLELAAWAPPEGLRRKEGCVVGEGTKLGDQVNMRASAIGSGCEIGSRVKIHNCVIMDNVKIRDNCSLQNTVVCPNATIEEGCSLTDCIVGYMFTVASRVKSKGDEFERD